MKFAPKSFPAYQNISNRIFLNLLIFNFFGRNWPYWPSCVTERSLGLYIRIWCPLALRGFSEDYYFSEDKVLFSGDTLFSLGCGRLFEGSAIQMVESLKKLRLLPGETKIYCGHEYTQSNANFAIHLSPKNKKLKKK